MVVSPTNNNIHIEALRHTYLHFVLDPLARQASNRAGAPEANSAERAEGADGRRVQDRRRSARDRKPHPRHRGPHAHRSQASGKRPPAMVTRRRSRGLRSYRLFLRSARTFEHGDTGLKDAFPDWLHDIDVDKIKKQASDDSVRLHRHARRHAGHKPRSPNRRSTRPNGHWPAEIQPELSQLAQEALAANEDPGPLLFCAGQRSFARAATCKTPRTTS